MSEDYTALQKAVQAILIKERKTASHVIADADAIIAIVAPTLESAQKEAERIGNNATLIQSRNLERIGELEAEIERLKVELRKLMEQKNPLIMGDYPRERMLEEKLNCANLQLSEARNALQVIKESSEGNEPLLMSIHSIARRGLKESGEKS